MSMREISSFYKARVVQGALTSLPVVFCLEAQPMHVQENHTFEVHRPFERL